MPAALSDRRRAKKKGDAVASPYFLAFFDFFPYSRKV